MFSVLLSDEDEQYYFEGLKRTHAPHGDFVFIK